MMAGNINSLFSEDFDFVERDYSASVAGLEEVETASPSIFYTFEDIEVARQEGYGRGKEEGVKEGTKISEGLSKKFEEYISRILCELRETIISNLSECAESAVLLLFKKITTLFPSQVEKYGDQEKKEFIEVILPYLKSVGKIKIVTSEDDIKKIKSIFGDYVFDIEYNIDNNINIGDFKIIWEYGDISQHSNKIANDFLIYFEDIYNNKYKEGR